MAKIIIDETELQANDTTIKAFERMAIFFDQLQDPYRMPELMVEYFNRMRQDSGGIDTYYYVNVGYGPNSLSCHMTFKRNMLTMEFRSPDGTRLMELRLHALQEKRWTLLPPRTKIHAQTNQSNTRRKTKKTT